MTKRDELEEYEQFRKWRDGKKTQKQQTKSKKRFEFSKILICIFAFFCISWVQQNYVLAFMEKQEINAEVTSTIVVTLMGAIIAYYIKSAGEKVSRNVSKVDENGVPYAMKGVGTDE